MIHLIANEEWNMARTKIEGNMEQKQQAGVLVQNAYGKSKVRLTKVTRHQDRHELKELSIDIQLEGAFDESYITGDNAQVIATDSMRNTVYVLAAKEEISNIESFGKSIARHFLSTYTQVTACSITLVEELWQPITNDRGQPHPNAFFGAGAEKHCAFVRGTRDSINVESAVDGLNLVKTTDSEFWGFVRDQYTTLPEVKDRIFGTSVTARWLYGTENPDYQANYEAVRTTILEVFATQRSLGVQHTMHEIAQVALERLSELSEITITMPNKHRILFNLQPFGLENKNEIFVTTDEPHGLISATIKRK
jgi:urate oxidase